MKIIWEFDPNDEDDKFDLAILRNAHDCHAALFELSALMRTLYNDPELILDLSSLKLDGVSEDDYEKYIELLEYVANRMSETFQNVDLEE